MMLGAIWFRLIGHFVLGEDEIQPEQEQVKVYSFARKDDIRTTPPTSSKKTPSAKDAGDGGSTVIEEDTTIQAQGSGLLQPAPPSERIGRL
jgi:hypothetical protein